MSDTIPPQRFPGLTPWLCEYDKPDGVYGIVLHGTDPAQIIRDHGNTLKNLRIIGTHEGTVEA